MLIVATKWGLIEYDALLSFYVDFDFVKNAVRNETYIVSIWLFRNIPKMFKNSMVTLAPHGLQSSHQVLKMIKKIEQVKGVTISPDKKKEIIDAAQEVIEKRSEYEQVEI